MFSPQSNQQASLAQQKNLYSFYIRPRKTSYSTQRLRLLKDFSLFTGKNTLRHLHVIKGYKILSHRYTYPTMNWVAANLLSDPLVERYALNALAALTSLKAHYYVEVCFRPGITDNEGMTLYTALKDCLKNHFDPQCQTVSTTVYSFQFAPSTTKKHIAAERPIIKRFLEQTLMNPLIEHYTLYNEAELRQKGAFPPPTLPSTLATQPLNPPLTHSTAPSASFPVNKTKTFTQLTTRQLQNLSKKHQLHLSSEELQAIQAYYKKPSIQKIRKKYQLDPQPTQAELEMLAQTWSEHCKHKIFNATLTYHHHTPTHHSQQTIHSLYKTYIKRLTATLAKERTDLLSVFHDNAGVFSFTEDWSIAMKVETHNTPSALDPFGGALTGIVGVNRDIIGTGKGAKPLFNTNVFCLANPQAYPAHATHSLLPVNVHHPKRMLSGVHYGVERGGNESGIPTVNGAMVFAQCFLGRPLVFCGTGGLLERTLHKTPGVAKPIAAGDFIVMAGGRVGKDGIHGATASSHVLSDDVPSSIVQIGDPITQKKLLDFLMVAKQKNLYRTLTDNGAGGLASSVGEMAQLTGGAVVHLDHVPLKYPNLAPWEILVSEAQERMTLAVPPHKWKQLQTLAHHYDSEVAHIGTFTASGHFIAYYQAAAVVHLTMKFLHNGTPRMHLKAIFTTPPPPTPLSPRHKKYFSQQTYTNIALLTTLAPVQQQKPPPLEKTFLATLTELLRQPNIASKENWVRRYDHEVKARTVIKPFDGAAGHGPNDAAVIRPLLHHRKGLAIANGILPRYGALDAAKMTQASIDEALRNLIAVGADPASWVGLDNFAWPNPLPPTPASPSPYLGQLVRSAQALYQTCLAYKIPLISGKDSMKNDAVLLWKNIASPAKKAASPSYRAENVAISPTLLFTALGTLHDIDTALTAAFKRPHSFIYLAGMTFPELGASEYAHLLKNRLPTLEKKDPSTAQAYQRLLQSFHIPQVHCDINLALYRMTHRAIANKLLLAAHDLSDGGLLVALSECAFGGMIGADVHLARVPLAPLPPLGELSPPPPNAHDTASHPLAYPFETYAYSESHGRFLFEVHPKHASQLEKLFASSPIPLTLAKIGTTCQTPVLKVHYNGITLKSPLHPLREAWLNALDFKTL